MTLSIIIPTLNEENHLPLLLNSIKQQNFQDYEIIVADGGSTDKTVEIAKKYGCKIVPGGSPARGRNEGAKVAQGDLLLFLDADCLLSEDFLGKIINEFKERELDIATCLIKPFGKSKFAKLYYDLFFNVPSSILEKIYPNGTGLILVEKELHQRIRGFDEKLKTGEDHEYIRRAAKLGKYRVLRSDRFFWSERRFLKEGWFKMFFKYTLFHLFGFLKIPIKLKYEFNHYKKPK